MIWHWLIYAAGIAACAWGVYYAGFRWNASDESFLHRAGCCQHTHDFCAPPGPKSW